MTFRIFLKLILAVLLVMIVALTTIDVLGSRLAEQAYVEGLTRDLSDKARMLGALTAGDYLRMDREAVHALSVSAGARITVVRPDGLVLLDSEADASLMENHGGRMEIREALQGRIGVVTRPSPTLKTPFLYVAGPIRGGAVRLAVPLTQISVRVNDIRAKLILYTALAFVPAILLAAFFARYFSRRLGKVIDYAYTLATGNFRARLRNPGDDELGILGRQLNETGSKLQKMFEELEREHVELEKLERVRRDFVINVSHELRTPLASIQGYTETLLDGALHDKDHNVRFLNIIRQNAERLTRLTADLLTLSRIELKTQKFQSAIYSAQALLHDCCESLQPVAEKKSITLHLEPCPPGVEVFCDAEAVHQIMSNLLDNAIKYSPEGGRVAVTPNFIPGAKSRPAHVRISVTDNGMGIPAEELPRLFERFYRVDKARSRELGGTGLGLAIVKHLTRAMGGDVAVESVPGNGSTFSFTLPCEDPLASERPSVQTQLTAS